MISRKFTLPKVDFEENFESRKLCVILRIDAKVLESRL